MSRMNPGTEIACDRCGHWEHAHHLNSMRLGRIAMRERGWRVVRRDGRILDLCPSCFAASPAKKGKKS